MLDELRDGGRAVGIVSHVAELRQRIPAQLRVERGRAGSHIVRPATPRPPESLSGEQGEVGLALAAQDREVHDDAVDAAGLGQRPRLRLDDLGGEDAAASSIDGSRRMRSR